jgi:hypothetical protein
MRPFAPAGLAAVAILAAGCGSHTPVSKPRAVAPTRSNARSLLSAAAKSSAESGEHVVMTGTFTVGSTTLEMTGDGDFQNQPAIGSMNLSMDAGAAGTIKMSEVMSGTVIYMSSPLFSSTLPSGKSWLSIDLAKVEKSAGIDVSQYSQENPTQIFARLKQTSKVTRIGSEQVDGEPTTVYGAVIDPSKLGAAYARLVASEHIVYQPMKVWIGDDGLLRRLTFGFTADVAGKTSTMVLTEDLSNYGEAVKIDVPSPGETLDGTKLGTTGAGG